MIKNFISEVSDFIKDGPSDYRISEVFAGIIKIYNSNISNVNVDSVCTEISSLLCVGVSSEDEIKVLNDFFVKEDSEIFLNKLNSLLLKEESFGLNVEELSNEQLHDLQVNFQILSNLRRAVLAGHKNMFFKKTGYYDIHLGSSEEELSVIAKKIDLEILSFLKASGIGHNVLFRRVVSGFNYDLYGFAQKYKAIALVFYVALVAASIYIGILSGHMFSLAVFSTLVFAVFSVYSIYEVLFDLGSKGGNSVGVFHDANGGGLNFAQSVVAAHKCSDTRVSSYMDMLKEEDESLYNSETDTYISDYSDLEKSPGIY